MLKLNSHSQQLTSIILICLTVVWRSFLSEKSYYQELPIISIKLQQPKSCIPALFQASQFSLDLDKTLGLQSPAKRRHQGSNLCNVCIVDSVNERLTRRYMKPLSIQFNRRFVRKRGVYRHGYLGEGRAAPPRSRQRVPPRGAVWHSGQQVAAAARERASPGGAGRATAGPGRAPPHTPGYRSDKVTDGALSGAKGLAARCWSTVGRSHPNGLLWGCWKRWHQSWPDRLGCWQPLLALGSSGKQKLRDLTCYLFDWMQDMAL